MKQKLYTLLMLAAAICMSGCSSQEANQKYTPWEVGTMTPVADPNVTDVSNILVQSSSYWSFMYLFGVYEVNHKYAGFDILFFIDFTDDYAIDNVRFENEDDSLSSISWTRTERLKKMTLGNLCMKSRSDIILSPTFTAETNDCVFLQDSKCRVKCFGGYLNGFKVNGKVYKDAYFPESNTPKTSVMLRPSK